MKLRTWIEDIGLIYSLFIIVIILGGLGFEGGTFGFVPICVYSLYGLGELPYLAMYIDFSRGAHDAEMAERVRLRMCRPFCNNGLDMRSMTYSGMLLVAAICFVMSMIMCHYFVNVESVCS